MTHEDKLKLLTNNGKYKSYAYSESNGHTFYYIYDERNHFYAEIVEKYIHYYITNYEHLRRVPININALNELVNFVGSVKDTLKDD